MKLDYNIITSRLKVNKEISSKNFKEKTNVFGYFILKLVWLYHLNEMLEYFSKTNKNNILDSNKSYGYIMSLLDKTKNYIKKGMLSDIKNDIVNESIKYEYAIKYVFVWRINEFS